MEAVVMSMSPVNGQAQHDPNSLFEQRRMEVIIDMATKRVLTEVQKLAQDVHDVKQLVQAIQKQAAAAPSSAAAHYAAVQPVPGMQQPVQQSQPRAPQQPAGSMRYGNYTSQDVSIEKFFGFGGKK